MTAPLTCCTSADLNATFLANGDKGALLSFSDEATASPPRRPLDGWLWMGCLISPKGAHMVAFCGLAPDYQTNQRASKGPQRCALQFSIVAQRSRPPSSAAFSPLTRAERSVPVARAPTAVEEGRGAFLQRVCGVGRARPICTRRTTKVALCAGIACAHAVQVFFH